MTARARRADTGRRSLSALAATAGPTLWARGAAHLLGYAEQRGADRAALLQAAALDPASLSDPDARVPLVAFYELVEVAVNATGDPHLGLGFAGRIDVETFDALGFLVMTSGTFGEALERMLRYQRLWNDGERFTLEIRDDRAHITYTPFGPDRPAHGQVAEMFAFDVLHNGGALCGAPIRALSARFRHAPAADPAEKARLLGAPAVFGDPITELVIPAEALSLPLPHANEALSRFLDRQVQALAERLPVAAASLGNRVRALLAERLHEGADLDALAARLRMSPRTLQRRLRDEGTSLQDLRDEARRARAAAFLETGMAVAEVAYLLGYSEPSAFHRAFRRWTGSTPEEFRRAQAASPPRPARHDGRS